MIFNQKAYSLVIESQKKLSDQFIKLDEIALLNQNKVLNAFKKNNIGLHHMSGSTGYGYDDIGRDSLAKVFADIFKTDSAIVSPSLVSGTHTLTVCLFGILRPGDLLLSISGNPYDTLLEVISGKNNGSLKDFNISYDQIDLIDDDFDYGKIRAYLNINTVKMVFIGRSRGYSWRNAIKVSQIEKVCKFIKAINDNIVIMIDNCYGEFVELNEPSEFADLIAGSLIKNPGGGITPTGGYICGKKDVIEQISYRLTSPSLGTEVGSYAFGYTQFYQGIFLAPHTVSNAVKGSMLFSKSFSDLGYNTMPTAGEIGGDIITAIKFNTKEELITFCQEIQANSPIDSYALPLPWDMPGYKHQVIMAAGTFIQGASIELSADSPIVEPYIAYIQGGLTFEHIKIALINCITKIINEND